MEICRLLADSEADRRGDLGHGQSAFVLPESRWDAHLDACNELPAGSIVYHIDRGDSRLVHEVSGAKFGRGGGVPDELLAFGTPDKGHALTEFTREEGSRRGGGWGIPVLNFDIMPATAAGALSPLTRWN